ncbi:MAG: polysulfide reductase NrfD, partial [Oligoflexales bacterium]|nr:polysulfide reductase NrfD [Oligoflexales bacterium]
MEQKMSLYEVTDVVTRTVMPPTKVWFLCVISLFTLVACFVSAWIYQIWQGMGVAGLNHPVCWGLYIASFIFWVGIAHSGTLISAILYLVRASWRKAVGRAAEAMTVFAVLTAGLFPLIHLGRLWVFVFILPYPSDRQLWPNFTSPLVMDVVAVTTYLTVSSIFWYVGLIPDLAQVADHFEEVFVKDSLRTKIYRILSFGWSGSSSEWRHYDRSYLFFSALATPLVISVHSIVSWDFAVSHLPGWHTTLFAPYFVAGAIHSGLAMVLTLVIPMRSILKLKLVITEKHLEQLSKTILVTTMIIGYAYVIEPWTSFYSGDRFEIAFAKWRFSGELSLIYYLLPLLNVIIPSLFFIKRIRTNLVITFIISIIINIGMWLERYFIVTASLSHDFMPHNWGSYLPRPVEIIIAVGTFAWFFMLFLIFTRFFPTVAQNEMKEEMIENELAGFSMEPFENLPRQDKAEEKNYLTLVFDNPRKMLRALKTLVDLGYKELEVFTPMKIREVEAILGKNDSPVRYVTFFGAAIGCIGGFFLPIFSASVNG